MSRFGRIRRRPDSWTSPHDRARLRAAQRLDGPLGLIEATWLEEHLAGCAACASIAAAYAADRGSLRVLRDVHPEPPRDLWARTAAGIEQGAGAGRGRRPAGMARGRVRIPVGTLSGVAVIVVLVGLSAVSSGLFDGLGVPGPNAGGGTAVPSIAAVGPAGTPSTAMASAAPTPFSVGAGQIQWIRKGADGALAYNAASIRKVCRVDNAADCATLDDTTGERLALTAVPKSIIGSPTERRAVVFSDDGTGRSQVIVLSLPAASEEPTASPSPVPTPTPATPTQPALTNPPGSAPPATEPPASPGFTGSPAPTAVAPTATASPEPTLSVQPSPSASVEPSETVEPTASPEPTLAANLAIASDVTVVGDAAAFSADGAWFAFTARPLDGSAGPDIYVWNAADETARALTADGHSYFASWDGGEVVASRPGPATTDGVAAPVSVLIDPLTGTERPAGDLWRPVVDPSSQRAVAWVGSIVVAADGSGVVPGTGRLELRGWSNVDGARATDGVTQLVSDQALADFDVRWDETGTWFATWMADPSGSDIGRLSLYRVESTSGLLERPTGAPVDVPALAGFSISDGHLAWATPPGQGGEGSRVQIVAWAPDGVGTVETAPGEGVVVVR